VPAPAFSLVESLYQNLSAFSVVTPFDCHPFLASSFIGLARGVAKLCDLRSVRFLPQVGAAPAVLARPLGDIVEAADDNAFDAPAFGTRERELHAVKHAEDHGRPGARVSSRRCTSAA
jgi:hypothetical protein